MQSQWMLEMNVKNIGVIAQSNVHIDVTTSRTLRQLNRSVSSKANNIMDS